MRILLIVLFMFMPIAVFAKEVKVAFGLSVPPYIIQENNTGIESDIIREALAYKGHIITPIYIPFSGISSVFIDTQADAAATVEEKIGIDGFFSNHVISYQNYAIALKQSPPLIIKSINDLYDKKVMTFQSARRYMGTAFAEMAKENPRYREKEDYLTYTRLLYSNVVDVVIADKNIVQYATQQLSPKIIGDKELNLFNIFPPNHYKVVFRDKTLRDDFNEGLQHLKKTGRYQKIFDHYLQKKPQIEEQE